MSIIKSNLGWQRVLLIIVPYIIIVGAFQTIGLFLTGNTQFDLSVLSSIQILIIFFCGLLGYTLVLWFFVKIFDEKLIDLGFNLKRRGKDIISGFVLGLAIMGIALLFILFAKEIKITSIVFDSKEIIVSILNFIIVAFVEEAFDRGYILRNLMVSFNKYVALILSAIIFSLIHCVNPDNSLFNSFNLFLAGIILGMTYIYTQNLWFPISLHFSWNLFQSLFGFNVSGQYGYSIINFDIINPNVWNGGKFGFEGTILCTIIQLLVIAVFFIYKDKFIKLETNYAPIPTRNNKQ